jgi:hypothetical protein
MRLNPQEVRTKLAACPVVDSILYDPRSAASAAAPYKKGFLTIFRELAARPQPAL